MTLRFTTGFFTALLIVAVNSIAFTDEPTAEQAAPTQVEDDWEAKIEKALAAEFSFKGVDLPLKGFADRVSEETGITVLLDRLALSDVGIDDDVPLTRNLARISLRSVLRLLLRELDLTYELRDGALIITTPQIADRRLVTRWYDVSDLAAAETPPGSGRFDCDQVTNVITGTISPYSWDRVGGSGAIHACRGSLVVSQTRDVHKEIDEILAMIRKAMAMSRTAGVSTPPVAYVDAFQEDSAVQRIRNVLRQPITVDFDDMPLEEVMDSLREQCRINLEIDTRALNDQGIGTDLPITFRATDMRLEFVLRHILDELNLTFVINDEVLLIITPEEGERWISTRLYLVGDLLGPIRGRDLFGDPIRPTTIDELIEMITTIVAPHCWSRVGGQGSLERFSEEDLLVVYQTDDAHDELVTTLARFRANLAKGATKADPSAEPIADGEPTRLVVYFVQPSLPEQSESGPFGNGQTSEKDEAVAAPHPCKADELAELIEELIEFSDEKERDDVYVRAVSGRLVIRHTDHVHKQIEKLLTKLRIQQADAPQQPWTDGLGGGMF